MNVALFWGPFVTNVAWLLVSGYLCYVSTKGGKKKIKNQAEPFILIYLFTRIFQILPVEATVLISLTFNC